MTRSRKVKCDETKPLCKRCTNTGRHCEGYVAKPLALDDHAFGLLLMTQKAHHPFGVETSKEEGRALQYFYTSAGPLLSSADETSFWTSLVMQLTHFEPAVRHSVIAISLLHEQMHQNPQMGLTVPALKDEVLSLKHYNLAIAELKSMDAADKQPVVLFACVLFICIELLQANRDIALQHCKHGLAILSQVVYRNPWTQEHLIPIFRRLSMLLYLFGNDTSEYAILDAFASPQYEQFESFADAQVQMDEIFRRTLRLFRRGEAYRMGGLRGQPVADDLHAEQGVVNAMLDHWHNLFTAFDDQLIIMTNNPESELYDLDNSYLLNMAHKFLSSRYEVCRIWANMAFATDEVGYDDYMEDFERTLESLETMDIIPNEEPSDQSRPLKFSFETGFQPVVYFLVTKCRDINLRLRALRMIKVLGVPQENMWNTISTFQLGRRVIELEHDVVLDSCGRPLTPLPTELPQDSMRVRESWSQPQLSEQVRKGKVVVGRSVSFLLPTEDGGIHRRTEFLCEDPRELEEDVSEVVHQSSAFDVSLQLQSYDYFRRRWAERQVYDV